eukprot:8759627-Alexandrium_andersonii.AAC.1
MRLATTGRALRKLFTTMALLLRRVFRTIVRRPELETRSYKRFFLRRCFAAAWADLTALSNHV